MAWKLAGYGGKFGEGKKFLHLSVVTDPRNCDHVIALRDNGELWHYVVGRKNYPVDKGRKVGNKWDGIGSPCVLIKGSALWIYSSREPDGIFRYYAKWSDYPDPSDEEEPPPPPELVLPEYLQHKTTGIIVSPYFAKCGFINKVEYTRKDFCDFIDLLVTPPYKANAVKFFLYGVWYPGSTTKNLVRFPHPGGPNGPFVLSEINPEYWEEMMFRLDYTIKAGLLARLIYYDYCQVDRAWNFHWLNPRLNTGWNGKETYPDKYGSTHWANYVDHGAPCTPEEYEMYETTKDYILHGLYDKFMAPIEAKYKGKVTWENNEIHAYALYHICIRKFLEGHGIPMKRRITSPVAVDYVAEKPEIHNHFLVSLHGVCTNENGTIMDTYYGLRNTLLGHGYEGPWIPSGDGGGDNWFGGDYDMVRQLIRESHRDGNYFPEGNSWASNPKDVDPMIGQVFMEEYIRQLES